MFLQINEVSLLSESGTAILDRVSFTMTRSHKLAIVGETGSGKSSLLKIIAGLLQPDSGLVKIDDEPVIGPADKLVPGHPQIQYLSQHFELQKSLRVGQILSYANTLPDTQSKKIIDICDISHLQERRSDELSGGEKQRIALARILLAGPRLILLDEPFSNLDMIHRTSLQNVIRKVCRQLKVGCILVSHDPEDTLPWADTILVMKDGQVVQSGTPMEIYHRAVDEYVAGLFGKFNVVSKKHYPAFVDSKSSVSKIFVRPERIKIDKKRMKNSVRATIVSVNFHGGYYELTLDDGKQNWLCHVLETDYVEDDSVYLTITDP